MEFAKVLTALLLALCTMHPASVSAAAYIYTCSSSSKQYDKGATLAEIDNSGKNGTGSCCQSCGELQGCEIWMYCGFRGKSSTCYLYGANAPTSEIDYGCESGSIKGRFKPEPDTEVISPSPAPVKSPKPIAPISPSPSPEPEPSPSPSPSPSPKPSPSPSPTLISASPSPALPSPKPQPVVAPAKPPTVIVPSLPNLVPGVTPVPAKATVPTPVVGLAPITATAPAPGSSAASQCFVVSTVLAAVFAVVG